MNILSPFKPKRFLALMKADAKNVIRDPVLIYVIILAILPVIVLYFWGNNIEAYFKMPGITKLALPTILTISAFLIGWVVGFLILEERDDGPLLAIEITPIGKRGLMLYRLSLTCLMSVIITLISIKLLSPEMGWGMRIFYALLIGLEAISVALIIPTLASNKVEGLAVAKLINTAAIMPALALIPSPWRYLGGIFPTYWIGESFQFTPFQYLTQPMILSIAIVLHFAVFFLLYYLFTCRIG